MALKCFMCGAAISRGILCEKCDKPRKKSSEQRPISSPPPPAAKTPPPMPPIATAATAPAPAAVPEEFPKAPLLQFPVESASPAITSVANVLIAGGVAAIVIAPDRNVKFVTDEAKKLFGVAQADLASVRQIEGISGGHIGELSVPTSAALRINDRNILFTLVPISGGASGAVLVFREAEPMNATHASFVGYVRETVFAPLRALREAMRAATGSPLFHDAAATIEQILSSLEMAPEVKDEPATRMPKVTDIIHSVADHFGSFAELKGINLQVDVPELEERFKNAEGLRQVLGALMDNSMHYVPPGGQVVIGVRWMEHKGKPLLLFFVMDNGPVVPETLRQAIFEPGFAWNPSATQRSGRALFKVREFAVAHEGSVWVESKTGKACTFFLRVRPDSAR
ncbi:MAG: HAMP domain-containing sensor histidine kinase [Acidobacteriota bacterium]